MDELKLIYQFSSNEVNHFERFEEIISNILFKYKILIPNGPPQGYKSIMLTLNMMEYPTSFNFNNSNYFINLNLDAKQENCIYAALVFQFAHELCHIYCNLSAPNSMFIESVCCISSYYFLDYFSREENINSLELYKIMFSHICSVYLSILTDSSNFNLGKYSITKNILLIDGWSAKYDEENERNLQEIVAKKLFPFFNENEELWSIIPKFENLERYVFLDKKNYRYLDFKKFAEEEIDNYDLQFLFKRLDNLIKY